MLYRQSLLTMIMVSLLTLLIVQTASADFGYTLISGPTIVQNNGNGTWIVQWEINVTTLSQNDNSVCVTAGAQTVYCGNTTGNLTCTVNSVPNGSSVAWSIDTYTANNGSCDGSLANNGPSGTISQLSVELAEFGAVQQQATIAVSWETASELNNRGFYVWRSTSDAAPETQLNAQLIAAYSPGSAAGHVYEWEDGSGLVAGSTYYYWLEALETSGAVEQYGPVAVDYHVPTAVSLGAVQTMNGAGRPLLPAVALLLITLAVTMQLHRARMEHK